MAEAAGDDRSAYWGRVVRSPSFLGGLFLLLVTLMMVVRYDPVYYQPIQPPPGTSPEVRTRISRENEAKAQRRALYVILGAAGFLGGVLLTAGALLGAGRRDIEAEFTASEGPQEEGTFIEYLEHRDEKDESGRESRGG